MIRRAILLMLVLGLGALCGAPARSETEITVAPDGAILSATPVYLRIDVSGLGDDSADARIDLDGRPFGTLTVREGENEVTLGKDSFDLGRVTAGSREITVSLDGASHRTTLRVLPGWVAVLPPLIAILLALLFKEVLLSLFVGIFFGALLLHHFDLGTAFARTIDTFIRDALANPDHASILIFSLLGGMVGVITRSGGTQGIVAWLARYATNGRRGLVATWLMGLFIFFDDYANTLIVGSTMRPVTDRLRISREKLAYIVDSTAAPIATMAPISTWVGYEVGLITPELEKLGLPFNAYGTFLASIPYLFYPLFMLVLGFTIAYSRRDAGPMLRAERRALETGDVVRDGDVPLADFSGGELAPTDDMPLRARNAFIPILVVIVATIYGLWVTGSSAVDRAQFPGFVEYVREVISAASSYSALLWGSLLGVISAVAMAILTPNLKISQTMTGLAAGFRSMLLALVVLVLAWSLGAVSDSLHTASYLVGITEGVVSPVMIPALVFVLSAAIAFATGTSWATMAILMPLVIPIVHTLATGSGLAIDDPTYRALFLGTISSVLAGSVWGDHCSPISDTTILSSMASGCDHIAHVRTQIPYALSVGIVGLLVGNIPTALGVPVWISLIAGVAVILLGVRFLTTPVERPAA